MKSTALASLVLCACGGSNTVGVVEGFAVATRNMASTPVKKAEPSSDAVPGALVEHAVAWASANGLGMVVNDDEGLFTSTHLPFSLLPSGKCFASSASSAIPNARHDAGSLSLTVQIVCTALLCAQPFSLLLLYAWLVPALPCVSVCLALKVRTLLLESLLPSRV